MDPATIGALSSILGIGGSFFGGNDRLSAQTLAKYFGPEALNRDTQTLFNANRRSPFGQFGMQNAALQGSLIGNALRRKGASIGGSGIGMLASSAASATQAFQQGDFLSNLFSQAGDQANSNLQARLAAYAGGGNAPSGMGAVLGGLANAGGQYALLGGGFGGGGQNLDNVRNVANAAVGPANFNPGLRGVQPFNQSNFFSSLRPS